MENNASRIQGSQAVGKPAKVGAILFCLWSILHLWVGFEGVHQFLTAGAPGLWNMLTGGSNAPHSLIQMPVDALTANAHEHLILNFCIDVAGYGILGLVVSFLIWTRGSWLGYLLGVFIIGIADLAFLFSMVTTGIIELNLGTVSGPAIWFLAILITPFGLSKFNLRQH